MKPSILGSMFSTIGVLGFLCLAPALANSDPASTPVLFNPPIGKPLDITIVKTQTKTVSGKPQTTAATLKARLTYLTKRDDGYSVSWENISIAGPDGKVLITGNKPDMFVGVPIKARVGADGGPLALEDWEQLKKTLFESTFPAIKPSIKEDQEAQNALAQVKKVFDAWTPDVAAQIVMKDATYLSICQHTDLVPGRPLDSEDLVPNPLGGPAIKAKIRFELRSVDRATGRASVRYSSELDQDSLRSSLITSLKALVDAGRMKADEMDKQLANATVDKKTVVDCQIDLDSGMVVEADAREVIKVAGQGREDRRQFRVSAP